MTGDRANRVGVIPQVDGAKHNTLKSILWREGPERGFERIDDIAGCFDLRFGAGGDFARDFGSDTGTIGKDAGRNQRGQFD